MAADMVKDKRATRGQRMTALIGEAADQDDSFWGADVWNEEDDDSFSEQEVEPDVFDSDFNDSEDDLEEGSSDEENTAAKARKREKPTTNKYKEPGIARKKAKHVDSDDKNEDASAADKTSLKKVGRPATSSAVVRKPRKVAGDIDDALMSSKRAVRQSTNNKTKEALSAQKRASSMKSRVRFRPPIKHQFTQQELLLDALTTEAQNRKWLEQQKLFEYERAVGEKLHKAQKSENKYVRFTSRRGTYDTVTFSDVDIMPAILTQGQEPVIPQKVCVITGLPAKYKDPLTGHPYANIEAFVQLRKRHGEKLQSERRT